MDELKSLQVLYVEDDDATRAVFSKFLRLRVGRLTAASSGEEGLQKFQGYKPNLLIVDLIMPGMSGLDMIGEIRKSDKECPILITSTVNEINTVLEAVDLGIVHYIVKPIDTDDLQKKLLGIAQGLKDRKEAFYNFNSINLEKRGLMEDAIRREFLKIMKHNTGKGPQDVKILLFENQVELMAIGSVTVMERTLAANRKNLSMVEQFRKLFYEEIAPQVEECVEQATGYRARLTSVAVDGIKRIDKIILTIV